MKISELKINPSNPQKYTDEAIEILAKSITDFPKMMALRFIIYDPKTMFILGGNKRFLALQKLGYKEIPNEWIKSAEDLTEDEKKRLVVQDNIQAGDWDFEMLSEDYEQEELMEWGLEFENKDGIEHTDLSDSLKETFEVIVSCDNENEQEQIYNKLIGEGLECRVLTL